MSHDFHLQMDFASYNGIVNIQIYVFFGQTSCAVDVILSFNLNVHV